MSDTEAEKEIDRLLSIFSDFPDGDEIPGVKLGWLRYQAARIAALDAELAAARDAALVEAGEECRKFMLELSNGYPAVEYTDLDTCIVLRDRILALREAPAPDPSCAECDCGGDPTNCSWIATPAPDPVGEGDTCLDCGLPNPPGNPYCFCRRALAGEGE